MVGRCGGHLHLLRHALLYGRHILHLFGYLVEEIAVELGAGLIERDFKGSHKSHDSHHQAQEERLGPDALEIGI